jgi:hypothetical protein
MGHSVPCVGFRFWPPGKKLASPLAIWWNTASRKRRDSESHHLGKEGLKMSRMATPVTAQPAATAKVPHEKIAQRAYEKWCKRGQAHGHDKQDWAEAEAELRAEMARTGTPHMGTHPTPQATAHRR